MELMGWFVIVPFSVASLLSGVIQSLGTQWGLFRHYWVIAKLSITVGASLLLMLHMQVVSSIALAASSDAAASSHVQSARMQVVADAGAAVIVLLLAVALSIYKPAGRTDEPAPRWVRFSGAVVALFVIAFILSHVGGGGMHGRH
jgi:hypothetical protein